MRFVTLFPECENVHLMKEQGMIPYFMSKEYNMDGVVACYMDSCYNSYGENGFSYIEELKDNLEIEKIDRKTRNKTVDGLYYLLKNARKIDVLYIFHLSERSLYWYLMYKLLNPKGKVYLELDADREIFHFEFNKFSIRRQLELHMIRKCDLVSNSIKSIAEEIGQKWEAPIKYIPRGFYTKGERIEVSSQQKEKVFCTVGRIGTWQKATEVLLDGFRIFSEQNKEWKLQIVGPIEKKFENYIERYFTDNPKLRERVIFTGGIYDKEELDNVYIKSKVFCITSRLEAFALVYAEALKSGCYIISSKVDCVEDVLQHEKYGTTFEIDNSYELAEKMLIVAEKDENWFENACIKAQDYAYKEFFWPDICKKVYEYLFLDDCKSSNRSTR